MEDKNASLACFSLVDFELDETMKMIGSTGRLSSLAKALGTQNAMVSAIVRLALSVASYPSLNRIHNGFDAPVPRRRP